MSPDLSENQTEALRQIQICNACRYCEGYCAVFPAMFEKRSFGAGDITQLANLCHNCRGCYYACQYTQPHEFALNLPAILAETRRDTWEDFAWPRGVAKLFQRHGVALIALMALAIAALFWAVARLPGDGEGFYAHLGHAAMVALFLPAFVLPSLALAVSLMRYWRHVGGAWPRPDDLAAALGAAATLRNLDGGQGQGCNFEDGDRFSNARRFAHQAVMWGFLLCFGATASATLLHYAFGLPAPYGPFSLPKLLGVPGGIMLVLGAGRLMWLKSRADRSLGDAAAWGGESAFTLLLGLTGLSGLMLYWATGSAWVSPLLAMHLGLVMTLFLTTPYSKMAHAFYRLAALLRDAQIRQGR